MNIAQPSVSVVLVTYNRARLLDATIGSIVDQTLTDFELIIADDASPDNTEEVCRRWVLRDGRIRYHRRSRNVGMPQNLNLGILDAVTNYVAILHDDDMYHRALLAEWKTCLDENPRAAFVFNAYDALDSQGRSAKVFQEPLPRSFPGAILLEKIFFKRWRFTSPVFGTVMLRRTAFDKVGALDERYGFWADVDMWMRLAEEFDVCYVDAPLISVRSREVAPHQFEDRIARVQPLLERMFWEARMRHYQDRPLRRLLEAGRHAGFVAAARAYLLMIRANSAIRGRDRRRGLAGHAALG
jgi:glycosyltransferase involved in cell wall biosynthesis